MKAVREELFRHCEQYVDERIREAQAVIATLQASANEETKSSAGDKYETGRAMAQLEIEKYSGILQEAVKQRQVLHAMDLQAVYKTAKPGAVVFTDNGNFFISISAGQFRIGEDIFICLSPMSPLGMQLKGKMPGDSFVFNKKRYQIIAIH